MKFVSLQIHLQTFLQLVFTKDKSMHYSCCILIYTSKTPQGALELIGGYVLLPTMDNKPYNFTKHEVKAFNQHLQHNTLLEKFKTYHWAGLLLPNHQHVWCLWQEQLHPTEKVPCARNIQVCCQSRF